MADATAENQNQNEDLEGQNTPKEGPDSSKGTSKQDNQEPKSKGAEATNEDDDFENWEPAKVKDYVKQLRKENKGHRQKAKGLEDRLNTLESGLKKAFGVEDDENIPPEKRIEDLTAQNEAKELRLAILESAIEHGISGKEGIDYFEFLVSKKLQTLGENEELSDEDISEISQKVSAIHGTGSGGATSGKTSFPDKDNSEPKPGPGGEVTLEQFNEMDIMQKSELFRTNKPLYDKLMAEAKAKKMFR